MNKPKEILKNIKAALASNAGRNFLLGNIIIAKGGMSNKQQNEMVDSIIKKIDALLDDQGEAILSKIENVANLSAQDIVKDIINAVAPQFNKIAESQCQNFNKLLDKINALELDEDKIFSKLDDIKKAIKEDGENTRADIANAKDDVKKHSDENTEKIIQAIVSNGRAMAIHSHSSTRAENATSNTTSKVADFKGFIFDVYAGGIRITKYTGNAKVVVIPSLIEGKSVTSIGDSAFRGCTGLTSITIPDSVTSIGSYAFYGCTGLTNATIGDGVTSIGSDAFYKCSNLTSITIPDSVKSIGDWAFYGCSGLTSVTIGDGVTSIGALAFYDCSDLIDVYYQGDLSGWLGIQFDSFSSTPMEYADNLYINGVLLQGKLVIPEGTEKIGDYAFQGCDALTRITIPDSVERIGMDAFHRCDKLTIYCEAAKKPLRWSRKWNPDNRPVYWGKIIGGTRAKKITGFFRDHKIPIVLIAAVIIALIVIIPIAVHFSERVSYDLDENGTLTIYGSGEIAGKIPCDGVKNVIIEEGITRIGDRAFWGCTGLTSITIPDSVTSIGDWAFHNCTGLTRITIPNSVTSIGDWAFDDCTGLTKITIPDSVTNIGIWAFNSCTGLTDVYYQGDLSRWLGIEFGNYASNPMYYADNLYINGELLQGEIVIPEGTEKIGEYAFYNCRGLTGVTISGSITSIGNHAFEGCTGLTSITIPDSVTSIGEYAFSDCTGLTSITIPNSVTSIGDSAFYGCTGLTSITIPDSVTSIGDFAFSDCTGLTSITIPTV